MADEARRTLLNCCSNLPSLIVGKDLQSCVANSGRPLKTSAFFPASYELNNNPDGVFFLRSSVSVVPEIDKVFGIAVKSAQARPTLGHLKGSGEISAAKETSALHVTVMERAAKLKRCWFRGHVRGTAELVQTQVLYLAKSEDEVRAGGSFVREHRIRSHAVSLFAEKLVVLLAVFLFHNNLNFKSRL